MKKILTIFLWLSLAPSTLAIELPTFGGGNVVPLNSVDERRVFNTEAYGNDIDKEIALATYEFTFDEEQAFDRLESALLTADSTRKRQIESQLFINYLFFSNLVKPKRSEKWLYKAAQLYPSDPRPHRRLRELYCLQQQLKQCKQSHIQAVRLSTDEATELKLLGDSLNLASKYRDAIQVYAFAIEAEREKQTPNSGLINILKNKINQLKLLL